MDSPWARHQQRALRLVNEPVRVVEATPGGVPEWRRVREFNDPRVAWKPVSQL